MWWDRSSNGADAPVSPGEALPRKSYAIPYVIPYNAYGKAYEIPPHFLEIIPSGNPYGNPKTSYITYGNP